MPSLALMLAVFPSRPKTAHSIHRRVIFEATESVKLDGEPDSKGQVTCQVPIRALDGGLAGNVAEDTIKLMVEPIKTTAGTSA